MTPLHCWLYLDAYIFIVISRLVPPQFLAAKVVPETKKQNPQKEGASTGGGREDESSVSALLAAASDDGAAPTEKLKRFPDRLIELLNTEAADKSLYWLPGGKAFAIEQQSFSKEVLDKFFQATKFSSFVRRLHKWYVPCSVKLTAFSWTSSRYLTHHAFSQTNRGFRRETRGFRKEHGPDFSRSVIAFSHDLFQKDAPHLVEQMEEIAKKQQAEGNLSKSAAARRGSVSDSSLKSLSSDRPKEDGTSSSARMPPMQASAHSSPHQNPNDASSKLNASQEGSLITALSGGTVARATASVGATNVFAGANAAAQQQQQGGHLGSSSGSSLEHQLLLRNLRNNALETSSTIEALLRQQQQQNDSFLQRDIIAASLDRQQQQWQQHQRDALLSAATTQQQNQALLDAATRERLVQLGLAAPQQPTLAQQHFHGVGATAHLGNSRLANASGESNSQLVETLLLMELQRQREQQGGQQPPPPGGFRQFPPFG